MGGIFPRALLLHKNQDAVCICKQRPFSVGDRLLLQDVNQQGDHNKNDSQDLGQLGKLGIGRTVIAVIEESADAGQSGDTIALALLQGYHNDNKNTTNRGDMQAFFGQKQDPEEKKHRGALFPTGRVGNARPRKRPPGISHW